jgi:glycosyltransferase involved in cell wall biosynthesis
MKTPELLVTIITPTFNQGQFIEATIKSVLAQTYQHIEYVVIDAMSTDATAEILAKYAEKISRVIREPDEGQSDAIVKGFKMAQGDLVGWINSDDLLYPDCVEKIVAAYQKTPQAILFYNSQIDIISEDGSFNRLVDVPIVNGDRLLRQSTTLVQPGSFYKNAALAKVGYFNKALRFSMDLDLWLRLLKVGDCVNIASTPIAGYREWGGTKTSTGDAKLLRERKKLLISHGAQVTDKTVVAINFGLVKCYVKNIPYLGGACKALVRRLKVLLS